MNFSQVIRKIVNFPKDLYSLTKSLSKIDEAKVLNGKILSRLNNFQTDAIIKNIHLSEFKIFSQWGDDGIIQFLVDYLDIENKIFIEFGVENYKEANTRFLLINNNWKGLVMDGSSKNIHQIRQDDIYWKYALSADTAFITKENINSLIKKAGFEGDIGLLHIDIDGNDYWVWKEIDCIQPTIVIVEYNGVWGSENPWTIPYFEDFHRTSHHYSNLYFGSSLLSLCDLAEEKGYCFIGSNSNGNNAYFIKKGKEKNLKTFSAQEGFILSVFKESRDRNNNLSYLAGNKRLNEIKGMNIFNTRTSMIEIL